MRFFCLNDIAFFYYNGWKTNERRIARSSFVVTNDCSSDSMGNTVNVGVELVATQPVFVPPLHIFFIDNSFPTQCSFLLLNVVLSFVVNFL